MADEVTCEILGQWVAKAEHDLATAESAFGIENDCPCDTVAFLAQQCVEKYLKTVLVLRQIPFPKTHNLNWIMRLLPETDKPALSEEELSRLTRYATEARYPGDYDPVTVCDAGRALDLARKVRAAVRGLLPEKALGESR